MDALGVSRVLRLLVFLVSVVGVGGCEFLGLFGPDCAAEPRPGIRLVLVDASSGALVSGPGVTVVAANGVNADSAVWSAGDPYVYVGKGTYRVEVSAPGYERWTQEGVEVHADECGPIATELEAQLMPEG